MKVPPDRMQQSNKGARTLLAIVLGSGVSNRTDPARPIILCDVGHMVRTGCEVHVLGSTWIIRRAKRCVSDEKFKLGTECICAIYTCYKPRRSKDGK